MFELNISKARAIVKLDTDNRVLRCSFAFEFIAPRPDLLLALPKDIIHFLIAVRWVVMKKIQSLHFTLGGNAKCKEIM